MTKKSKIMVVDDSSVNIKIIQSSLEGLYDVFPVNNGQTVLARALEVQPDLVLLDVVMPDVDGYDVIKQLKGNSLTRDIPVIFVTSLDDNSNEEYGLDLGAIDYIRKPFSAPVLKARVRNHLELKQYRDKYKELASIDGMTGLYNRRKIEDELEMEWQKAVHAGEDFSVILIDIDFFKQFNDQNGHLAGDDCIKDVAKAIKDSLPGKNCKAGRYGGEEFVCILGGANAEKAKEVAQTIAEKIKALGLKHEASSTGILTVSQGVASIKPGSNDNLEEFLKMSDTNLYKAKNSGRNCVIQS